MTLTVLFAVLHLDSVIWSTRWCFQAKTWLDLIGEVRSHQAGLCHVTRMQANQPEIVSGWRKLARQRLCDVSGRFGAIQKKLVYMTQHLPTPAAAESLPTTIATA